ncbi:MAG: PASTA domain-containing protein [Firmicutes bacterium]|nr:PASTA domain-containing protein [Bacillota bacterium]
MTDPVKSNYKRRVIILFAIWCCVLLALGVRLGWIMLVDGEEYSNRAVAQQTKDTQLAANRGYIYDRNMKELAVNAPTYTVWVRPSELKDKEGRPGKMANLIASAINGDPVQIAKSLQKESSLVRVARNLDSDQADKIRKYIKDGRLPGISIDESTRRYYPYGDFASCVIGHINDDGNGVAGLELAYNTYLSGMPGRVIRNTDSSGRPLYNGTERYYESENGLNLVLTIDEVLQHYLDTTLEDAYKGTSANAAMGICMDVKTGEILAMGYYPSYDLNDPRQPVDEKEIEAYEELETDEDRVQYWNKMWRNFLVSDTYEPGSTFKLITTAIALEEGLTSTDESFFCNGAYQLYTDTFTCRYHGAETLTQALENSCNIVAITLGLRIGAQKYFEYLDTMGFSGLTGIDLPSETSSIMYNPDKMVPGELATMTYGQGIAVTPIQLITAVASIANGGDLVRPHVVAEVRDDDGQVIYRNDTTPVRKIFSEETSKEMCKIMQSVVDYGTGKNGYIPGYKIGGKTGTADAVVEGHYAAGKVFASFVAIAPSDDPQIITLIIADNPKGAHSAGTVVVPYVRDYLEDALTYLQVEPDYTDAEKQAIETSSVSVTDCIGHTVAEAKNLLEAQGLKPVVTPNNNSDTSLEVVDQYPKAGDKAKSGSYVYIYTE